VSVVAASDPLDGAAGGSDTAAGGTDATGWGSGLGAGFVNFGGGCQFFSFGGGCQLANFGGGSQLANFGGGSQLANFGGGSQLANFGGGCQLANFGGGCQLANFGGGCQPFDGAGFGAGAGFGTGFGAGPGAGFWMPGVGGGVTSGAGREMGGRTAWTGGRACTSAADCGPANAATSAASLANTGVVNDANVMPTGAPAGLPSSPPGVGPNPGREIDGRPCPYASSPVSTLRLPRSYDPFLPIVATCAAAYVEIKNPTAKAVVLSRAGSLAISPETSACACSVLVESLRPPQRR
jgi:hypothetical protein